MWNQKRTSVCKLKTFENLYLRSIINIPKYVQFQIITWFISTQFLVLGGVLLLHKYDFICFFF